MSEASERANIVADWLEQWRGRVSMLDNECFLDLDDRIAAAIEQAVREEQLRQIDVLDDLSVLLREALQGTRYNSSWIRPLTLPPQEREALYKTAQMLIDQEIAAIRQRTGGRPA
jgi:hypothetical protein